MDVISTELYGMVGAIEVTTPFPGAEVALAAHAARGDDPSNVEMYRHSSTEDICHHEDQAEEGFAILRRLHSTYIKRCHQLLETKDWPSTSSELYALAKEHKLDRYIVVLCGIYNDAPVPDKATVSETLLVDKRLELYRVSDMPEIIATFGDDQAKLSEFVYTTLAKVFVARLVAIVDSADKRLRNKLQYLNRKYDAWLINVAMETEEVQWRGEQNFETLARNRAQKVREETVALMREAIVTPAFLLALEHKGLCTIEAIENALYLVLQTLGVSSQQCSIFSRLTLDTILSPEKAVQYVSQHHRTYGDVARVLRVVSTAATATTYVTNAHEAVTDVLSARSDDVMTPSAVKKMVKLLAPRSPTEM